MGASLQLPGGLKTLNPQPEIARYYNNAGTAYSNTAQVLSEVVVSARYIGQTFLILDTEYWFNPTTDDLDLVVKIPDLGFTPEDIANKGVANGYAPLDSNAKVPLANINDALIGNVSWQGLYDATTNIPDLTTVQDKGNYYVCSNTAQAIRFGLTLNTGDWIISNGTAWEKVDNTDAVSTVFGRTGNVTAQSGDYNTAQVTESTDKLYVTSADKTNWNSKEPAITSSVVTSFWSGLKTFRDLATDVRAVVLTGLSTASTSIVAATDSILGGIGKLQAQISNKAVAADITTGTDLLKIPTSKSVFDSTILPKKETIVSTGGALNNIATPTEILRFTNQVTPVIISGLVAPVGFKSVIIFNDTLQSINILHQSVSSSLGNRLSNNNNQDLIIQVKGFAKYVYSDSLTSWVLSDLWASDYFPTMVGSSKRAVSVTTDGYATSDDIVEIKTYLDGQTTNLTTAQLNVLYPDYQKGQEVICQNITTGGVIYQKVDDGTDEWIAMAVTKASVDGGGGRGLMTATGEVNKLAKYSSTSNVAPSSISDDGTLVTVNNDMVVNGTFSPDYLTLNVDSSTDGLGAQGTNTDGDTILDLTNNNDAGNAIIGTNNSNAPFMSVNVLTGKTGYPYESRDNGVVTYYVEKNGKVKGTAATASDHFVTKSQLDSAVPYKEYVARITQDLTNPPGVDVLLSNGLGETVTYARVSTGYFTATISGSPVSAKIDTFIVGGTYVNNLDIIQYFVYSVADGIIRIETYKNGTLEDGLLENARFQIRIYN